MSSPSRHESVREAIEGDPKPESPVQALITQPAGNTDKQEETISPVTLQNSQSSTTNSLPTKETPKESLQDEHTSALHWYTPWVKELGWLALSIACIIVIVVVLNAYDGRALPSLPMNITLNTFLSFLSSLAKVAFMVPVAECISQSKWNWFQKPQPLSEFQVFDDSMTRTFGSVRLVRQCNVRSLATLGVLISLASIITSPLTQQMIAYQSRRTPSISGTAMVQATQIFYPPPQGLDYDSPQFASAIAQGIGTNWSTPFESEVPSCSTGNCTYPKFESLGICSKSGNITSYVDAGFLAEPTESDITWGLAEWADFYAFNDGVPAINLTIPDAYNCSLVTQVSYNYLACALYPNTSLLFQQDSNLMHSRLISLAVLYTVPRAPPESGFASNITSLSSVQYEAAELIFYPCINEYEVLVESGNPTTTVVSSSYEVADPSSDRYVNISCYFTEQNSGICDMDTYSSVPWDVTVPAPMMYLKDPASPNSNTTTFGMTYGTLAATAVDLFNALSGFATYTADGLAYVGMGEVPTIWYNLFGNSTEDATQRAIIMDALMQNVATSMTNVIRMFPSSGDGMNSFTVNGTATSPETFVEIHWGWLAFLASELVLSIIFVIGTIIHTARLAGRVLNSSSLAALAALDESSRSALGGIDDPQAMKRKAAGIRVQLLGSELVMV